MNEPMYPDLPPKPTPLEKLLLFMVAGLTVAVIVLGVYVSSQGDKIEQLQGGSSDSPSTSVGYHVHNYATTSHEHSSPLGGGQYADAYHLHWNYADENHTHWSSSCVGQTGWPSGWTDYEYHTHSFNC